MSTIDFYTDNVCEHVTDFDSGYKVFNDYVYCHCDKSVIHYILESKSDRLIAYFSLMASALPFDKNDMLSGVSAIELKMFALDKRYQGSGVAPYLFEKVIETIEYCAATYVGAEIILFYSVPVEHVLRLYERNGFQRVSDAFIAFKDSFTEGCVPMYKVL